MQWEKIKYPFCFSAKLPDNRKEIFEEFIKFFGFDRITIPYHVGSYSRFLHGSCSYNNVQIADNGYRLVDRLPDCDHGRAFKKQGTNQIVYVNQPYQFKRENLEQWCNERELYYVICDRKYSFYYPNNTEMVLIMSMSTYNEFLRIPKFPLRWKMGEGVFAGATGHSRLVSMAEIEEQELRYHE